MGLEAKAVQDPTVALVRVLGCGFGWNSCPGTGDGFGATCRALIRLVWFRI